MTPAQEKYLKDIEYHLDDLEWELLQEDSTSKEASYLRKALRAIDRAIRVEEEK